MFESIGAVEFLLLLVVVGVPAAAVVAIVRTLSKRKNSEDVFGRVGSLSAQSSNAGANDLEDPAQVETTEVGTPEPDEKIGWERYALNFVLAGFVGLGLSFALRTRGWLSTWISAGVLVVAVVLIAIAGISSGTDGGSSDAFEPGPGDDLLGWNGEWQALLVRYDNEYYMPLGRAVISLTIDCSVIDPDPNHTECNDLVETIAKLDVAYDSLNGEVRDLVDQAPPAISAEEKALLVRFADNAEKDHESNVLIVEGWHQGDAAMYQEGWDLAQEVAMELLDIQDEMYQTLE